VNKSATPAVEKQSIGKIAPVAQTPSSAPVSSVGAGMQGQDMDSFELILPLCTLARLRNTSVEAVS
jgi:hypothetical protein